jgi:hypothetical protein
MAQDIQSILQELDAGYNPQRQAINDQIAQLQPQADAQVQGLNQQKDSAYRDISRSAADRGMYFSSIPSQDQSDYVQKTYVPALAQVQTSLNSTKSSLLDSLNNVNLDQRKTAYGIRDAQLTREQAAADAAAARAAQAAQNASLGNLFGGGGNPTAPAPQNGKPDKYANVDRNAMQASVNNLLKTGNVARINQEYNAIKDSALKHGNIADQYKLELFNAAMQQNPNQPYNPTYANLIKQAMNYKAPAAKPGINYGKAVSTSLPNLVSGNPMGALSGGLMNALIQGIRR